MNNIVDKDELGFNSIFCHKIIRKRNRFLIENNLPKITFSDIIPRSYCPINFINNINDEIYENIENKILKKISDIYKINVNDIEHNICYYVENNFYDTTIYHHVNHCNYSYGYIILLNEKMSYEGGDVYIDGNLVQLDNSILFFKLQDNVSIANIVEGEQHKLIGFVNYSLNQNNDIIDSFKSKKLNIFKTQNYITSINDILNKEKTVSLHKRLYDENETFFYDNENTKKYIVLTNEHDTFAYSFFFTYQYDLVKTFLSNFNLNHKNMLPIKICKYENIKKLLYFTPIFKDAKFDSSVFINIDENLINNSYIKFTLFICINEVKGKIIFPNQNLEYDLYNGAGIIVPNHLIYSFYITIFEKNIIDDSVCFLEISYY